MADNKFTKDGYTDLDDVRRKKLTVDEMYSEDISLTNFRDADLVNKERSKADAVNNPFITKKKTQPADTRYTPETKKFKTASERLRKNQEELKTLNDNDKKTILLKQEIAKDEKLVNNYYNSFIDKSNYAYTMNKVVNRFNNENYSEEHKDALTHALGINEDNYNKQVNRWDEDTKKLNERIQELESTNKQLSLTGGMTQQVSINANKKEIESAKQQIEKINKQKEEARQDYFKKKEKLERELVSEDKEKTKYEKRNSTIPYRVVNKTNEKVGNVYTKVENAKTTVKKEAMKPLQNSINTSRELGKKVINSTPVQKVANSALGQAGKSIGNALGKSFNQIRGGVGKMSNTFKAGMKKALQAILNICKSTATFLFSNPVGWVILGIIIIFNLLIGLAVMDSRPDGTSKEEATISQEINSHAEQEDITQLKAFKARVESKNCYYENEDTEDETYVCEANVPSGSTKTYTTMFYDDYHVVVSSSAVVPIIWTWKSDDLWDKAATEEANKIDENLKPGDEGYIGTKQYWINVVNNYWDKVGLNERELKSLFIKRVDYKYQYLKVEWSNWSNVPQTESDALEKDSESLETFNNNIIAFNDQYRQVSGKCYWVETIEHEAETAERGLTTSELNSMCGGLKGSKLKACRNEHKNDTVTYTVKDAYTEDITHYETCTYNQGRKATKISWTQDASQATKIYNTVDEEGRAINVTERTSFINWDGKHDGNWFVEYLGDYNANQTNSGNYSVKRIKTFKVWTKEEVYYLLTHEYYPKNDTISLVNASWNSDDTINITNDNSGNPDDHPFPEGFDKGDSTYFGDKEVNYTPLETTEGIEAHDLNPTSVVDNYIQPYSVSKKHIYVDWYNDSDIIKENYFTGTSQAEFETDLRAYYEILASLGHDADVVFLEGKIFVSPFYSACQLDDDSKISATISQHFGATGTVSTEFSGQDNHGAIDFTDAGVANVCNISQGWQINAAQNGTVVGVKNSGCYNSTSDTACYVKIQSEVEAADGNTYYIEHWYWHVAEGSVTVMQGDDVTAGDEIATVGNTGYSTGPHVHFETAIWSEKPSWWGSAAPFSTFKEAIFDSEELIQFSNSDIGSDGDMETVIPERED